MKKRSGAYPSKNLTDAEKFSVSVFEKVGDTFLKDKDLAKHGGVALRETDRFSVTSGQYGFMNQAYGKGYAPNSEICKALRNPKDGEKQQLYLNAFTAPALYKKIITEFNGKKITEEGLKIYLIRDHEFIDSGATVATKVFFENAKFLSLMDIDGNFNIDADIKIDNTAIKEKRTRTTTGTSQNDGKKNTVNKANEKPGEGVHPAFTPGSTGGSGHMKKIAVFAKGQKLYLNVPDGMTSSDWDDLIEQFKNFKTVRDL